MKWLLGLFLGYYSFVSAQTLKLNQTIDLLGPSGKRFDYLKIDYKSNYLFSAHLGADQVYVVDLNSGKVINTIVDTPGVEGIEYVPEFQKIYTSNWRDHTIGVVDLKTMKSIKKLPAEAKPDGSAYAEDFHKLYVSDELAKAVIVVDVSTDKVIKTLRFDSETGMPQYDPVKKKIYVNLQDKNLFVAINPETDTVEDQYSVTTCKGNHGMALDLEHRLAFLGCEGNDSLAIFSLETYKIVGLFSLPVGVDVIAYDSGLKRVYAACYSGAISVVQIEDSMHFRKLEDFKVQPKVHSLAVNNENHKIYVPEQEEDGKPVAKLVIYDAVEEKTKKTKK